MAQEDGGQVIVVNAPRSSWRWLFQNPRCMLVSNCTKNHDDLNNAGNRTRLRLYHFLAHFAALLLFLGANSRAQNYRQLSPAAAGRHI